MLCSVVQASDIDQIEKKLETFFVEFTLSNKLGPWKITYYATIWLDRNLIRVHSS